MFAFFGLGFAEIIVIGIIGVILVVVPVMVIVSVFASSRRTDGYADSNEMRDLRDEVRRLRAEVERLEEEARQRKSSEGIKPT